MSGTGAAFYSAFQLLVSSVYTLLLLCLSMKAGSDSSPAVPSLVLKALRRDKEELQKRLDTMASRCLGVRGIAHCEMGCDVAGSMIARTAWFAYGWA